MPGATFLEGDKVELRTVEEEDLEKITEGYNHPEIRRFIGNREPANQRQEKQFFDNIVSGDDNINLAISRKGEFLGLISLKPQYEGVAELGIWVLPEHHGNGYGTEAAELLVNHAFEELRYHKLTALVYEENEGSKKLWKKLGFSLEAELEEHIYTEGSYHDAHIYRILEDEWR